MDCFSDFVSWTIALSRLNLKWTKPRSIFALLCAVVLTGPVLFAQSTNRITLKIDSARVSVLPNHHPRWAAPANDAGAVPANQTFENLTLVLARSPEQEQAFEQFLAAQQDPSSPEYHHWLTPAEVGERFGLSAEDIAAMTGWLQSQGLRVNWVSPSRIFIGLGGTAGDIGRAFKTEMHRYRVNGQERVSVWSDPMIPAALSPAVKAIRGLYTIDDRPQHSAVAMRWDSPEITAPSGIHFIGPGDFYNIYDLPNGLTGAGITIGIAGRSRTNAADFNNFKLLAGSNFTNPTEVVPTAYGGVDPGPAYASPPGSGVSIGDQEEATLDVLRAGTVAYGAQLLLVVASEASGGVEADAQYLVNTTPVPAQVMTISFGDCESAAGPAGVSFWDSVFKQAAAEGISSFVSSGDSGASGCDAAFTTPPASPTANSPNYICSSSYVTCVGGTEFNDTGSTNYWGTYNGNVGPTATHYIPEGGWNESWNGTKSAVAASGGGVSTIIATPAWQVGVPGVPTANAGRYTPDVAFSSSIHDGYFACFAAGNGSCVVSGGGFNFSVFAGTSAAAPSMAGIAALLDQNLTGPQGNLNPGIYQMSFGVPTAFHDVTVASSGVATCDLNTPSLCNNSIPGPSGLSGGQAGFAVGNGYDEVTGLGSLDAATFVFGFATGSKIYKPTVTYNLHSWPANQDIPMGVGVSGAPYAPLPTGSVVVSAGGYTSAPTPLTNAYVYVIIPAGKLAIGNYAVSVSYTPDAASSSIYLPATGTGQLTVTAPEYIAPVIVIGPSSTTITNTEPVTVSVSVSGGSGNPVPTGTVTAISGSYSSGPLTLTQGSSGPIVDGEAVFNIPAGALPVGRDILTVTYTPDATGSYLYISNSSATAITNEGARITPTVQLLPVMPTISTADTLPVAVTVSGSAGNPTPTGAVVLTSGNYASPAISLSNGAATIPVSGGVLQIGSNTITVTYTPDAQSAAIYNNASGLNLITVIPAANASFGVTGTNLNISKGAISGNYSTITVTPANGFVGTVALTAAVASSPAGGQYPPTLSFQPASSISLTGPTSATVNLMISTTAATTGSLAYPPRPGARWYSMGGGALACILILCIPTRRRNCRAVLGMLMLLVVLAGGVLACSGGGGSGNSGGSGGGGGGGVAGTTSGTYTITVTGTSGSTTATGTVTLTVQ